MQRVYKPIAIYVRNNGLEQVLYSLPNEYRNLMELLNDKVYIEDFGDCKGMGRCGTCAIKVDSADTCMAAPERNEQTTLTRSHIKQKDIRLACQIMIDSSINGLRVEVIENPF
jgi:2Fe-2S ferredoxin